MVERNDGKVLGVKMSWELIRRVELDLLKKLENWLNSSEEEREKMKEDIEKTMKRVDECYRIVNEYPVPEDFYWSQMTSLAPETEAKLDILTNLFLRWKNGEKINVREEFDREMSEFREMQREIDRMIEEEDRLLWEN